MKTLRLILITPNLRTYFLKASRIVSNAIFLVNTLFLPLPKEYEELISRYISNELNYNELMKVIIENDIYSSIYYKTYENIKPLLSILKRIKRKAKIKINIICYKRLRELMKESDILIKLLSLIAKIAIFNKIKYEEWLNVLREYKELQSEINKGTLREIDISKLLSSSWIMICGFEGSYLKEKMREYGIIPRIRYITPYIFTPLEQLIRVYMLGKINKSILRKLAIEISKYIHEYVLMSKDNDEAYFKWIRDNYADVYGEILKRLNITNIIINN